MVSCSELEDENDEEDEQVDFSKVSPLNIDDKDLTVLEALPIGMSGKQIFHLPEEIHEQIVFALRHVKLYNGKVKDIKVLAKLTTYQATCNTNV